MRLGDIALARSGDKGAHANVGVWVQTEDDYRLLEQLLTEEVVARTFAFTNVSKVERFALPNLRAFNFLLYGALGEGGAAGSLRTDAQAKVYSSVLLQIELAERSEQERSSSERGDQKTGNLT